MPPLWQTVNSERHCLSQNNCRRTLNARRFTILRKWTKTALLAATTAVLVLAAGTFTSCSNGSSSTVLEISGDVLIKCYDENIPSDGFIEIPDGVTTIGSYAFSSCTNLKNVKIPDSVTTIGNGAFQGCYDLMSVTIPDSVTTIGDGVFYYLNLKSVKIGNGVTIIGSEAFYGCTSLMSVTIPDSVTSIGDEAFYWCESLTNVTIGSGVTSIGNRAFDWCESLTSVTFTDKEGWHKDLLYGTEIDVTDPTKNAINLKDGSWYSLYKETT